MNKKLLALAIGAVVAMPATVLAAGPTLYGQIDLSVENVNDNIDYSVSSPVVPVDSEAQTSQEAWVLRSNASRIGVRGEADTDVSDLKGIYQAEFGVKADDGAGPFSARNIFVGLQGGFGTLKAGNIDSLVKVAQGPVDEFNDSSLDMSLNGNGVVGEDRVSNTVQYTSPVFADAITVSVATDLSETAVNSDAMELSVAYNKDGLYLALASGSNVATGYGVSPLTATQTDILRAVAAYSTDSFEVGFLYQTAKDSNNAAAAEAEDKAMLLSGAFKMDAWKFKAEYGTIDGDDGTPAADGSGTLMAIGADYAMGKSTTAYALAGSLESDDGAGTTSRYGTYGVGLRQKF